MRICRRGGWIFNSAFAVGAAVLVAFALTPVPAQQVFAQTALPPPGCDVPPCAMIPMEPGTEIASVESGLVARIPASNTVVGFQTISKGSILIDIGDVAAPVTLQIETTPGELRAMDVGGQPLAIVEVSPGMYQVRQPS